MWITLLCLIPAILFLLLCHDWNGIKLKGTDIGECAVIDSAGSFSEDTEKDILAAEKRLFRQNGVAVCVKTVTPKQYSASKKKNLSDYAMDQYYAHFRDEKSWMIVFEDCGDQMTWRFEGIQGDDTKDALDSDYTSEFDERVTDDLDDLNRKGTYGEVFAKELNHLAWLKENRLAGDVFVLFCSFIVFFLVAVVIVWAFVYGIRVDTKLIQAKEVTRCPADADGRPMPVMTACPHCGKEYALGEKHCSYCGVDGVQKCSQKRT